MTHNDDPAYKLYKLRCGRRLRIARKELDPKYSQKELAALLGVVYATYNNQERGISEVDTKIMSNLKSLFGITYDWVYDGDPSGLPGELQRRVLAHRSTEPELFRTNQ